MRPNLVRQHTLPLWLLRGFGRGEAEASETTWCFRVEGAVAMRLRDAGSRASTRPEVYTGLAQAMAGGSRAFAHGMRGLRDQPPGPAVDPPKAIAGLVVWLAVRARIARTMVAAQLLAEVSPLLQRAHSSDDAMEDLLTVFGELDHVRTEALAVVAGNRAAHARRIAAEIDRTIEGIPDEAVAGRRRAMRGHDAEVAMAGLEDFEPTYQRHFDWLSRATFRLVDFPPHSLILGDSPVLRWDEAAGTLAAFSFTDPPLPSAILLPVAASRLLVGTCAGAKEPPCTDAAVVNTESARAAREFFVASAKQDDFGMLQYSIGDGEIPQDDDEDWIVKLMDSDG